MIYIVTNIWAILLATLASLAVGGLYLAARGARASAALVVAAIVAEFWLTSILAGALILAPSQAGPWVMAIGSAVVIWIGFVVPAVVVTHLSRRLSFAAAAADCAHWLVAMVVEAAVLHVVGLVHPPT